MGYHTSEERKRGKKFNSISEFVVYFLTHRQYLNGEVQNELLCNSAGDLVGWQERAKAEYEQLSKDEYLYFKHVNAVIVGAQLGI